MDSYSAEANALPSSVRACVQRLARFDGEFSKESRAAPAFIELLRKLGTDRARYQRLSAAVASTEPLDADQRRTLLDGARDACSDLDKRLGRSDVALGEIYRVGRGAVDLPVGSGQVPGVSTVRALQFSPPGEGGKQRMTGGQRAPFLVHFARDGVRSFAQVLYGISDDPESPHFSDQARLASEKVMPEVALTREALMREGAMVRLLNVRRVLQTRATQRRGLEMVELLCTDRTTRRAPMADGTDPRKQTTNSRRRRMTLLSTDIDCDQNKSTKCRHDVKCQQ
jgi:penicillin amidase